MVNLSAALIFGFVPFPHSPRYLHNFAHFESGNDNFNIYTPGFFVIFLSDRSWTPVELRSIDLSALVGVCRSVYGDLLEVGDPGGLGALAAEDLGEVVAILGAGTKIDCYQHWGIYA